MNPAILAMLSQVQRWAVAHLVDATIYFVVRQVTKFSHELDWRKVEEDWAARARKALPGEWIDDEGAAFTVAILEGCRAALGNRVAMDAILKEVAEKDWMSAAAELKKLIVGTWSPTSEAGQKTFALLKEQVGGVAA